MLGCKFRHFSPRPSCAKCPTVHILCCEVLKGPQNCQFQTPQRTGKLSQCFASIKISLQWKSYVKMHFAEVNIFTVFRVAPNRIANPLKTVAFCHLISVCHWDHYVSLFLELKTIILFMDICTLLLLLVHIFLYSDT